jgi:hypothetical protein
VARAGLVGGRDAAEAEQGYAAGYTVARPCPALPPLSLFHGLLLNLPMSLMCFKMPHTKRKVKSYQTINLTS